MSIKDKVVFHLVDDNDIDIAVNTKLLQLVQLTDVIYTYSGGVKFINEIKQAGAKFDNHFNIILLDIMMPVMNGFDCLEYLHKMDAVQKRNIAVYMLSSSIDRNDIMRAEGFPLVKKVLEKPLDIYFLKKSLEELSII